MKKFLISIIFLACSCNTGKLNIITDIDSHLDEASAVELVAHSDLFWTIEDAGNKNNIYGLNANGTAEKDIDIPNAKNTDWEDLTSDADGNVYIGDFGNNSRKRKTFTIYKLSNLSTLNDEAKAEIITFKLPKDVKSEDFEAFFLLDNNFYIFSKENKNFKTLKVPNQIGEHRAELVSEYNLDGKNNKITSAAISPNQKTIVLLNHDKLWKLTNFKGDDFFSGDIKAIDFKHNSQKEGICFKDNNTVYITDERNKSEGGNLYLFNID